LEIKRYFNVFTVAVAVFIAALYFYGNAVLFNLVYFALFLFMSFRALQSTARKRTRFMLIITYLVVMILQMAFYVQVVGGSTVWLENPVRRLFAVVFLLLPMIISRYVAVNKYTELYLPTLEEAVTIRFSQARAFAGSIVHAVSVVKQAGGRLSPRNFKDLLGDLPRHDTFRYVNAGSLTEDYFEAAKSTLSDPSLYIIISNTGTPASEIISVFTHKQFNHASISYDSALKTVVSYNGGARVYPPGLNREMVVYFNRKPDASILVYRLPVTGEQKRNALDKIEQINREGSAYNLLGLFINKSYKPNIMYCSQFVYKMLEYIGASYFEMKGTVKPTDLIEKDYFRKLEFVEELRLNGYGDKKI